MLPTKQATRRTVVRITLMALRRRMLRLTAPMQVSLARVVFVEVFVTPSVTRSLQTVQVPTLNLRIVELV